MTIHSAADGIHAPRPGKIGLRVAHESQADALTRAKGYPYQRPDRSFVFVNGPNGGAAAYTFDDSHWVPPANWQGSLSHLLDLQVSPHHHKEAGSGTSSTTTERPRSLASVLQARGVRVPSPAVLLGDTPLTPILAIGSNAGPAQLARKFPLELFPEGVVVPVVQCVLRGFDVVFAPLISSYGSVTATLERSPGTDVSVFVTYLTPPLQQRMHETEGAYNLVRLDEVCLLEGLGLSRHMDGVAPVSVQQTVYQYNHQCGTLHVPFRNPGDSPVALAEIPASGRRFPALTQEGMQAALRAALQDVTADHVEAATHPAAARELRTLPSSQHPCSGEDDSTCPGDAATLDEWILANLQDPTLRRARVAALTKAARPFAYEQAEVVLVIGTSMSTSVK